MPHAITFDAMHKRISILITPPIRREDALACFREVRTHPEFRTEYGIIFDLTAADRTLPHGEVAQLGEIVKVFFPGQKVAIVMVPTDSDSESAVELFQAVASLKADVGVFKESSDAEAWLAS